MAFIRLQSALFTVDKDTRTTRYRSHTGIERRNSLKVY